MKRIILISLLLLPLMTFVWSQNCCEAEEIATNNCSGLGCYIPQCTENCEWEPMQCWSSTGYCWCVDEDGMEIDGTSMPTWQGYPDCEEFNTETVFGYLHPYEVSDCQDPCSQYAIHHEVQDSEPINIIFQDSTINIELYINRFIEVVLGQEVTCVGCSAFEVVSIIISEECWYPNDCFVDPCLVPPPCELNTTVECISNYCGGCYADFYDSNGNLVDCYSSTNLGDINEDGILNVLDLVLIIGMILNNEYNLIADVNEDGIVNILDIVQLVNIILN